MNDVIFAPFPDRNIRLAWNRINDALVFNDSNSSDILRAPSALTCVSWLSSIHYPFLHYLAIQSYLIFEAAQNLPEINLESIMNKSKEYRAILSECESQITIAISEMNLKEIEINKNEEANNHYTILTTHCNMIRDYQMIWHLAEIFFIKLSCAGYFVHDLRYWAMLQQPHISQDYNDLIDLYNANNGAGDFDIESSDQYWITVLGLVLHGRKQELLNLLGCHTHSNAQAFRVVRDVLSTMPVFDEQYAKNGSFEFEHMWKSWHNAARARLTDGFDLFMSYPELKLVSRIIMGDRDSFFDPQIVDVVEGCWFYAIVPFLFYSQPLANACVVSETYKEFRRNFLSLSSVLSSDTASHIGLQSPSDLSTVKERTANLCSEEILGAINAAFNIDLGEFVSLVSRSCNSWWLTAHLVDLLDKINPSLFPWQPGSINRKNTQCFVANDGDGVSQIFDEHFIESGEVGSLREFFLIKYADGFVSHPSLMMMTLKYVHYCRTTGPYYINQIVDRLPIETEKFSTLIHAWCISHKYDSAAKLICRQRSRQCFKKGMLGNSLVWSIKGEDSGFVSRIADKLLRDMFKSDDDNKEAAIDRRKNMSNGMMDCVKNMNLGLKGKKITFVVRLYEVMSLIEESKLKEAAQSLIHLLESQLVSSHFNLDVLKTVRSLLTSKGLFTATELYQLMEVLEEGHCDNSRFAEVQELREILVQELSRACLKI